MITSITLCVVAMVAVVLIVRHQSPSMGLPAAYLFLTMLVHLPGAVAHALPWATFPFTIYTEIGIRLTAIGALCFVMGVWLARRKGVARENRIFRPDTRFLLFCLVGGWVLTLVWRFLRAIPTASSIVDNASRLWVIGIMLALPANISERKFGAVLFWLASMSVFGVWLLVFGGFLTHSTRLNVLCLVPLVVLTPRIWKVGGAMLIVIYLGMSLFVSYFLVRDDIREQLRKGGSLVERWHESTRIISEFQWIDLRNPKHLNALDKRLNQNHFVGLAAERLRKGAVEYRNGQTLVDGVLMLIPRAIWPNKPLKGGSHGIVAEMTGMYVNEKTTSFGVGNVMEFYINFGMPSLVIGFLAMGFVLGKLDYWGARACQERDFLRVITTLLPAFALVQFENAFIEQAGQAAAGLLAAHFWCWLWRFLEEKAGRRG